MERAEKIGEFIDIANLHISVRKTLGPDARVDWRKLHGYAGSLGKLVTSQAFGANCGDAYSFFRFLKSVGYDRVGVISAKTLPDGSIKANVDPLLTFHMAEAISRYRLRTVVLSTGDVDFAPVVDVLISRNIKVIVIGPDRNTASELAVAATRFYTLSDLGLIETEPRGQTVDAQVLKSNNGSKGQSALLASAA